MILTILSYVVVFGFGIFGGVATMCLMQISKGADEAMDRMDLEEKNDSVH